MASAQPWHTWGYDVLRRHCYRGDPPTKQTLPQDLRWIRYRLTVLNDSRERIELALRGAPLVWSKLLTSKWAPSKVMSKRFGGVSLFERSITASGKERLIRPGMPQTFARILQQLAHA